MCVIDKYSKKNKESIYFTFFLHILLKTERVVLSKKSQNDKTMICSFHRQSFCSLQNKAEKVSGIKKKQPEEHVATS